MKKEKIIKIIKSIAFITILILLLTIASSIVQGLAQEKKSSIQIEKNNTIDYLIVGDSLAERSVNPLQIWEEQGYTGFNIGVPSTSMSQNLGNLQLALEKQSPKIVFLEINTLFYQFKIGSYIKGLLGNKFKHYFQLYEYHDEWKQLFAGKAKKGKYRKKNVYETKGFNTNKYVDAYTNGDYTRPTDDKFVMKKVEKLLKSTINILNKKNIKLVLYSAPSPKQFSYAKHNAIKEWSAKNGIDFIDFNLKQQEIQIDWKHDTYDKGDHLNIYGARKVTKYISKYLKEKNILKTKKGDINYKNWDSALQKFKNKY